LTDPSFSLSLSYLFFFGRIQADLEVPSSVRDKMNTMETHVKSAFLKNSVSRFGRWGLTRVELNPMEERGRLVSLSFFSSSIIADSHPRSRLVGFSSDMCDAAILPSPHRNRPFSALPPFPPPSSLRFNTSFFLPCSSKPNRLRLPNRIPPSLLLLLLLLAHHSSHSTRSASNQPEIPPHLLQPG